MRIHYLEKDTCHLAVPLLRAACDRAAQSARGLPYASEIIACAAAIVEERQRAAEPVAAPNGHRASPTDDALANRARLANVANANTGNPMRWTDAMQVFRIGEPGEMRATREDGTVIVPWLGEDGHWHPPQGDGHTLARAYAAAGAALTVHGGCIVRIAA